MPYISNTDAQRREILEAIGVGSFEELIEAIPHSTRVDSLNLPDGLSEMEALGLVLALAGRNTLFPPGRMFAGGGVYNHYIPPVVTQLATRSEFLTAYTPYQPEVSQGLLQTIFEYQTYICELTGLDVSNASSYDGAAACADAVNIARIATKRGTTILSPNLHPHYKECVETYNIGWKMEILDLPMKNDFVVDLNGLRPLLEGGDIACVVIQLPNFYGCFESGIPKLAELCRAHGAKLAAGWYPFCSGWVKRPGELGADIAFGEGQPLGIPLGFGGPGLGFLACRSSLVRHIPGRLVGKTVDENGKTAYVMTLQAREQHIRRGKAGSSICTNEALLALTATVYLASLGRKGFREVGERASGAAHYLADRLAELERVRLAYPGARFFNEFVIEIDFLDPKGAFDHLVQKGFFAGIPLSKFGGQANRWLVATTEQHTREDLDALVDAVKDAAST